MFVCIWRKFVYSEGYVSIVYINLEGGCLGNKKTDVVLA